MKSVPGSTLKSRFSLITESLVLPRVIFAHICENVENGWIQKKMKLLKLVRKKEINGIHLAFEVTHEMVLVGTCTESETEKWGDSVLINTRLLFLTLMTFVSNFVIVYPCVVCIRKVGLTWLIVCMYLHNISKVLFLPNVCDSTGAGGFTMCCISLVYL